MVAWLKALEVKDVTAIRHIIASFDLCYYPCAAVRPLGDIYKTFERAQLEVDEGVVTMHVKLRRDTPNGICCKVGRCHPLFPGKSNPVGHLVSRKELRTMMEGQEE